MGQAAALRRRYTVKSLGLFGFLPAALVGCGGDGSEAVDESFFRLDAIYRAYRDFCIRDSARTRGLSKGPQRLEDLREHLRAIGDPDVLLASPVDGQVYVVVLGVNPASRHAEEDIEPAILAHERDGAGGLRWVLLTNGRVERMNQEAFAAAPKAVGTKSD